MAPAAADSILACSSAAFIAITTGSGPTLVGSDGSYWPPAPHLGQVVSGGVAIGSAGRLLSWP